MTQPSGPEVAAIHPAPTDDEAAAIGAALADLWSSEKASRARPVEVSRWRFSGRWWAKPMPARRDRP